MFFKQYTKLPLLQTQSFVLNQWFKQQLILLKTMMAGNVTNLAIMGLVMRTIVFFMAPQDGAVYSKLTH